MKLTFFSGGLSGGGTERVICNLANFLADQKHQCTVLTMSEEKAGYELNEKIKVFSLIKNSERKNTIYDNLLRVIRLRRYLRDTECDTYIGFLPRTIVMLLALRSNTTARMVVSERADPSHYHKLTQLLLKLLAKRADQWVFQTDDAKAWYGDKVISSVVIPNAINPVFIRPAYEGERRNVIVGAGRLNTQKNFALLINAFGDIAEEFPDYSLTIYGEGRKRAELEKLARERGVAERVFLPGYVSSLGDEIQDASLFVLSSDYEGMPNALIEAMALGLPCISTDCPIGGPKYLIEDNLNGSLTAVNDRQMLKEEMRKLLSDKSKAERMGQEATKIKDKLDPKVIYSRWEKEITIQ